MFMPYGIFKVFVFLLFASVILFTVYHPLQKVDVSNGNPISTGISFNLYGDLEQYLCKKPKYSSKKSMPSPSKVLNCPENEGFVSIVTMGRTGNLMSSYASVMAIAQQTGLKAYIPSCIKTELEYLFENMTLPTFKNIGHCPVENNSFAKSLDEWRINRNKNIILPRYVTKPKEVIPWIPNIWQTFILKEDLRNSAQEVLKKANSKLPKHDYTFVGVHVRRTDYKIYLKSKYGENLAPAQFFLNAMEYFKRKYPNTLFIVVSDEPQWCIKQFAKLTNVFVITENIKKGKKGSALDFAVLVACNHTILDYGTYGTWAAILAGGETVFYDMIQNRKEGSMKYNESWHLMS